MLDDFILLVGVSLIRPDQLYIGRVDWTDVKSSVNWKQLSSGNKLSVMMDNLAADLFLFKASDETEFEVKSVKIFRSNKHLIFLFHLGHFGLQQE